MTIRIPILFFKIICIIIMYFIPFYLLNEAFTQYEYRFTGKVIKLYDCNIVIEIEGRKRLFFNIEDKSNFKFKDDVENLQKEIKVGNIYNFTSYKNGFGVCNKQVYSAEEVK